MAIKKIYIIIEERINGYDAGSTENLFVTTNKITLKNEFYNLIHNPKNKTCKDSEIIIKHCFTDGDVKDWRGDVVWESSIQSYRVEEWVVNVANEEDIRKL